MTKNELKRLRYRAILNAYHNSHLASKASNWSNERIEKELGIVLPKHIPKIRKNVKQSTIRKKELEHKKYEMMFYELQRQGVDRQKAFEISVNNKRTSYQNIYSILDNYKNKKIIGGATPIKPKDILFKEWMGLDKIERTKMWSEWSKSDHENMPEEFSNLASKINKFRKLDKDNKLGYKAVFEGFINNEDPMKIQQFLTVEPYLPEMYMDIRKMAR